MKTELEQRTKEFAIAIIKDITGMPRSLATDVIGRQLLKSATSVGANYREANRAETLADFIHKIGLAEKEAAETQYWLEICQAVKMGPPETMLNRLKEAGELLAILVTIGKKARRRTK